MIKFGTDGWRALLGGEFNIENVERVALAMGKYIYGTFGYDKPVIIGYDPRNMAEDYATRTAELLYQKSRTERNQEARSPGYRQDSPRYRHRKDGRGDTAPRDGWYAFPVRSWC